LDEEGRELPFCSGVYEVGILYLVERGDDFAVLAVHGNQVSDSRNPVAFLEAGQRKIL
jgi:hypothetical protein